MNLIRLEREHQTRIWGSIDNRSQSVAGYCLIVKKELEEAEDGWMKNKEGRNSCLAELLQVAAVAVSALEEHGEYPELFTLYDESYYETIRRNRKSYIRELEAEVEQLHDRLEDNYYFDHEGHMVRCEPGSIPDGISCRDETIRLLREKLEEAEGKLAALQPPNLV